MSHHPVLILSLDGSNCVPLKGDPSAFQAFFNISCVSYRMENDKSMEKQYKKSTQDTVSNGDAPLWSSGISRKSAALIVRYARKRNEFLLFSIVLRTLQLLITLEPLDRFKWGFQQNVPLQVSKSNRKLKMSHVRVLTDPTRSNHISFPIVPIIHYMDNHIFWNMIET